MGTVRDWLAEAMKKGRREVEQGGEGGDVELSAQQRAAVRRGAGVVRRYGGVLLADGVGLGKTRVAVQMARAVVRNRRRRGTSADPVLFVVPARLRRTWRRVIGAAGWQCGRDAELVSHYQMSRAPWEGRPPVIVVDEAHRFRNPDAKRSRHLAMLTCRAPPILLTATPVCTRRRDLLVLLGYFLCDPVVESVIGMGLDAAFEADAAEEFDIVELLEEVVIRRTRPDFGAKGRPGVAFDILEYEATDDEKWLWQNLEGRLRDLSLAATGEHWPRGLLINNLLRMWESGPEALGRSLEELIHFHERWQEAVAAERRVERPEFRHLFAGVDRRQQVFSFLFGSENADLPDRGRRQNVSDDLRELRAVAGRVDRIREQGCGMSGAIAEYVTAHSDDRFLIFTAFRAGAEAIFSALANAAPGTLRVGLVTGDGARATGLGRCCGQEVLDRFLRTEKVETRHRSLRVLVATDCLAEGMNLQRCSRMILADLPYSPVKLEQRIGRIARPGSAARRVHVTLPRPRAWTDSLGMRRRLGERLQMARKLGAGHDLAGAMVGDPSAEGGQSSEEEKSAGPLAAMTRQERLWRQLGCRNAGCDVPDFSQIPSRDGKGDQLWVRVEIDATVRRQVWIRCSADCDEVVIRLSRQLPGLARLADDGRKVAPWEPGGRLWERARRWMQHRRQCLRAARLSPPLLGAGSEPVRLWRRLKSAVDAGRLDAGGRRVESWRRRLLQAHPKGLRFEMAQLTDADPSPTRLVRFVEELEAPPPANTVEVRAVAALKITA